MEEKLKKILECGVCLNVVYMPKQLKCGHSFCKTCLDNILKFAPNGSASIKCPNKCETPTYISDTQTTNDLQNNFMLMNASELAAGEGGNTRTTEGRCAECPREAVKYCVECCKFKCGKCPDIHDDTKRLSESFVGVSFRSSRERNGVVYCEEHSTEAEYFCCDREYLCKYCVRRTIHYTHNYQRLLWVDEFLKKQMQMKIYANATPGFVKRKADAAKQIEIAEKNLEQELTLRKRKLIEKYAGYLDEEHRKMRNELHQIGKQYLSAFESVEFFKDALQKEHFDMILSRSRILGRMNSFYMDSVNGIPGLTVSLDDGNTSDANPLGTLKIVHCNNASCKRFHSTFGASVDEESSLEDGEGERDKGDIQAKRKRRKRNISATENNTDAASAEKHQCQPLPVAAMHATFIKKSASCSFKVKHATKIYNGVYSDPVALQDWVFRVGFRPDHQNILGTKRKYAGISLRCENNSGNQSHWPLWCDVDITLKNEHSGKDITRSFSPIFDNNDDDNSSVYTLDMFGKWDDILDPRQGFLSSDESLDIHAVIEIPV